jgi:hypothetical protein
MTQTGNFDTRMLGTQACQELGNVFSKLEASQLEILSQELLSAKRIVCYGMGREGLMMEAIAMRLMPAGRHSTACSLPWFGLELQPANAFPKRLGLGAELYSTKYRHPPTPKDRRQ